MYQFLRLALLNRLSKYKLQVNNMIINWIYQALEVLVFHWSHQGQAQAQIPPDNIFCNQTKLSPISFISLTSKFERKIQIFVRKNTVEKIVKCGFEPIILTGLRFYPFNMLLIEEP